MSEIYAVAEYFRIAEDAFELNEDALAPVALRDGELLAVPSHGVLRVTPAHAFVTMAVAGLFGIWKVHHPVMGQVDLLP